MDIEFFKRIYNDDIIYHYTKASTAIDFILYKQELQFSLSRKSNDPIESKTSGRSVMSYKLTRIESEQLYNDENELHDFVDDMENRFCMICFCKNTMGEDFASPSFHTQFKGNEELFGFAKPRMWDQYADKYSGVCIAFSKEKILSKKREKIELITGDVKYLTYQELFVKKVGDIQMDHLQKVGKEQYKEELKEQTKESIFCKHKDYTGENEFRIGAMFDKDNCSFQQIRGEMVFDRTKMLDVTDFIEAIFVSSFTNDKQKEQLLQYAKSLNVEMIEMVWENKSFEAIDYKKRLNFFAALGV